jgi:murein DD-endopeptidase MepM/ murein hydrolase activator NlpD
MRLFRTQRRAARRAALVVVLVFAGTLPAAAGVTPSAPQRGSPVRQRGPVIYRAPLPAVRVVHRFRPPMVQFGAGHLGVDLAAAPGATVRAAGAGVVRFAGPVAGRGVVVLQHPDGIRTEYEPVRPATGVAPGRPVARGQPIGAVDGTHHQCRPGRCLHWGAKRGEVYLDPLTLLRPLGPVRLISTVAVAATLRAPPAFRHRRLSGGLPRHARGCAWA